MNIKNLTFAELQSFLQSLNLPSYRAAQVFNWVHQKKACQWDEMTNLSISLRQLFIEKNISLGCLSIIDRAVADDQTVKYLFGLEDGQSIESVFLPESNRNTICFSSQVGCGMGCVFCATGHNGLTRNLSVAEMVDQVLSIGRNCSHSITNLVVMGQGEPLANYDAVIKAIRILNDPHGLGIGARNITVSTCGIIPKIYQLETESLQINLAISLHSADNDLRTEIMPINRIYPLPDLLEACRDYANKTGRRVTFEYALINNVNDREVDAKKMVTLFDKLGERSRALFHINLIPLNPIPGSLYKRSEPQRIRNFANILERFHIETTIRKERGVNLAAACGQLQGKRNE